MNKKIPSLLLLLALTSTTSTSFAQTMPGLIPVSGTLTDADGALLTGEHDVTVSVHADEDGNAASIFEQTTSVEGSALHLMLDPDAKLAAAIASGEARYIELEIDGEVMTPRIQLGAVPYALRAGAADNAVTLGGRPASEFVNVTSLGSSLASAISTRSPLLLNEEAGKLTISLAPCEHSYIWRSVNGQWLCSAIASYLGEDGIEIRNADAQGVNRIIRIKDRGIEGRHIRASELTNEHLSDNADISPGKINGRAATLFGTDVQNFKSNTLVIDQNKIAINKPGADSGVALDVAGVAKASTFRGAFERSVPATGTVKLPASAFQVARGNGFAGDWQLHVDGYGQLTPTSAVRAVSLIAPIPEMPRDASITAMRCAYRISAGQIQGSSAELVRAPWATLTRTRNALVFTNPAAGQPLVTVSKAISGFTLGNNETSHVLVTWNHAMTTQNNSGLFFGCELDYSTTRL
jgi:hypothetical protein